MGYTWIEIGSTNEHDQALNQHGGIFLVDQNERHLEVWEVTRIADATENDDPDECTAQVYYFPADYTPDQVDYDIKNAVTRPDREEWLPSIDQMFIDASHFLMFQFVR